MIILIIQLLMLGHIKNFELIYDNKQISIPCRNKTESHKNQLKEFNVLKIFTRMAKANSLSQTETRQTKESQPKKSEQRFIVVSKFKNTTAPLQIIPKKLKAHRAGNKSYALDTLQQSSSKTFQHSYSKNKERSAKSSYKLRVYRLPDQSDKKSQLLIPKVNITQNYTQSKSKNCINNEIQRNLINSQQRKYSQTVCSQSKEKKPSQLIKETLQAKKIKSQSYIVVELQSEKVIANCRSNFAVEIASLTKIMTFFTVVQIAASKGLDIRLTMVKISEFVAHTVGTTAELIEGEEYTVEQLLYGLMLPSGNDAANELAYWGGSLLLGKDKQQPKACRKAFVDEMNRQARMVGLKNTHFANPHGLPHQTAKSTANDLSLLCCRCMKSSLFRKIVSSQQYKVVVKSGKGTRLIEWKNTNKLLRRQGFIGLKTGITVTAGPCLAAAYNFRNKTYISIILRAPTVSSRFKETRTLLYQALSKMHKDLTEQQLGKLDRLSRKEADSDTSSDQEEQFQYNNKSTEQHRRRCEILDYEL